jgi:hypothetical protein
VWLLALCLAAGLAGAGSLRVPLVRAQSANQGVVVYDLGDQTVSGTSWSLSGDYAVTAGAYDSITISNYGYCFLGPNDPRAGSAHAAAVYWYAELHAKPPQDNGYVYSGELVAGRGGNVKGSVTVTTTGDPTNATTHVDISLSGSDLNYYQGNDFKACLFGSN